MRRASISISFRITARWTPGEDLENEMCFITILRLSIPTTVGAKNSRLELVNIAAGELTLNIHLYLYEVESREDLENCFDVTTVTERQF